MNKKTFAIFVIVLVIVFGFSIVFAKSDNANQGAGSQNQNQNSEQNQGEETQNQEQNQEQENEGQINAEEHRSTVANFVQQLLKVADREKSGIGEQVKVIAQEQGQTQESVADQIESIEKRNKIKTFLFGTNYKNIGALRSEMVQTRNRIEQLTRLMEQTTNTANKTELQNQIQALEQERTRIENFLKANESKFSLFGWFVKLFVK